ncbi:hypothetical protein H6P81_013768 [Aristolochia fimbriata]|uniref:Uncharacterized protein n=1 Tax=Aristolochia fimbriata TaxID=158543 RepID=A0AAV7EHT8_ARIFI|nr:hypothetical protein H6P81_013768 [Aristolochia fimbriata]
MAATFAPLWNAPLQLHHTRKDLFSFRSHSLFISSSPLRASRRLSLSLSRKFYRPLVVVAAQSDIFKVFQTVLRVGKDGIEAGTNLIPDPVPRPIARVGVTVAIVAISLFVLKSVLSTVFFVLAMMGLIYFGYLALNKDERPKGGADTGASQEETLEEARRIMEKYK